MYKLKKAFAAFLTFILVLLPLQGMAETTSVGKTYNEKNTIIQNKYNIQGKVIKAVQFKDYDVVVTNDSVYFIKDGKAQRYNLGKLSGNVEVQENDKYVYITPYYNNLRYNLLKINPADFTDSEEKYLGDLINLDVYSKVLNSNIDAKQNMWFATLSYGYYNVQKLGADGILKSAKINLDYKYHYDIFNNMEVQGNTAWFKFNRVDLMHDYYTRYMIGRINFDEDAPVPTYFDFDEDVKDMLCTADGKVWVAFKDKVSIIDKDGNTIKSFPGNDIKEITKDEENNIYIFDGNTVKKLDATGFVKFTDLSSGINKFNINAKDKVIGYSPWKLQFKDSASGETEGDIINVGSHIRYNPYVLCENGKTIVLSDASEYNGTYFPNLNITTINDDGTMNTDTVSRSGNYLDYTRAKINGEDLYIPSFNTLYKLNRINSSLDPIITLDKLNSNNTYLVGMEFDNAGNIYLLYNNTIYFVSSKGIIRNYDYPNHNFTKIIKKSNGDIYACDSVNGEKSYNYIKLYKLNAEKAPTIIDTSINGEEAESIFLDENKSLEGSYFLNGRYSIYKILEDGTKVKDDRFDGQDMNLSDNYDKINYLKSTPFGQLYMKLNYTGLYTMQNIDSKFKESPENGDVQIDSKGGVYVYPIFNNKDFTSSIDYIPLQKPNFNSYIPKTPMVDSNKIWRVNFSSKINKDSLNSSSVFLQDESGQNIPIKYTLSLDGKSIDIAPGTEYVSTKSYTLYILKVQSEEGKKVIKPIQMNFTIK